MSKMRQISGQNEFHPQRQPETNSELVGDEDSPLEDFMGRLMTDVLLLVNDAHRCSQCGDKFVVVTDNAKIPFQKQEERPLPTILPHLQIRRFSDRAGGSCKRDERWSSLNEHSPDCAGLTRPSRSSSFDMSLSLHLPPSVPARQHVVMDYSNIPMPRITSGRADLFVPARAKLAPNLVHPSCRSQTNHGLGVEHPLSQPKTGSVTRKISL
jgi:hypothetical protein